MGSTTKNNKKWNETNYVGRTKIEKWNKLSGTDGVLFTKLILNLDPLRQRQLLTLSCRGESITKIKW